MCTLLLLRLRFGWCSRRRYCRWSVEISQWALAEWLLIGIRALCESAPYSSDPVYLVESGIKAQNAIDLVSLHYRDVQRISRGEAYEA